MNQTVKPGRVKKSVKAAAARKHAHKPALKRAAGGKPVSLFDAAQSLVKEALTFNAPTDVVLGAYFREHRAWGPRDRALLGNVVFAVVRELAVMKVLARHGDDAGAIAFERRLALLAWPSADVDKAGALDEPTRRWLDVASSVNASTLPEDVRLNMPPWLVTALRQDVGQGFDALMASLNDPAPLDLRVNAVKAKRDDVQRALAEAGVPSAPTPISPWGLRVQGKPSLARLSVMAQGWAEVQDEGSQLLALLMEAKRGEMVADFCAGGGGKTLALGAAMRNSGRLYAMDTTASRLAAVAPRAKRAGLTNIYTMALQDEHDERLERLAGKLDRVLVDAPCSGLGTLRRSPDLKWRFTETDIAAFATAQKSILAAAATLVKPGGRLVYATCSLLRRENEDVVEAFVNDRNDFVEEDVGAVLLRAKVVNAVGLIDGGRLRLWPHKHGTDGFFAAVLTRHR